MIKKQNNYEAQLAEIKSLLQQLLDLVGKKPEAVMEQDNEEDEEEKKQDKKPYEDEEEKKQEEKKPEDEEEKKQEKLEYPETAEERPDKPEDPEFQAKQQAEGEKVILPKDPTENEPVGEDPESDEVVITEKRRREVKERLISGRTAPRPAIVRTEASKGFNALDIAKGKVKWGTVHELARKAKRLAR